MKRSQPEDRFAPGTYYANLLWKVFFNHYWLTLCIGEQQQQPMFRRDLQGASPYWLVNRASVKLLNYYNSQKVEIHTLQLYKEPIVRLNKTLILAFANYQPFGTTRTKLRVFTTEWNTYSTDELFEFRYGLCDKHAGYSHRVFHCEPQFWDFVGVIGADNDPTQHHVISRAVPFMKWVAFEFGMTQNEEALDMFLWRIATHDENAPDRVTRFLDIKHVQVFMFFNERHYPSFFHSAPIYQKRLSIKH